MVDLLKSGEAAARQSKVEDIDYIAEHMRQSDIEEIWASHHFLPFDALKLGFDNSVMCITGEISGTPLVMAGVSPVTLLSDTGIVWLLATNEFSRLHKKFLRRSRRFIKLMLDLYPFMFNYVDTRNTESIKWLKWCGAKFGKTVPYGVEQLPFQYFEFRRS